VLVLLLYEKIASLSITQSFSGSSRCSELMKVNDNWASILVLIVEGVGKVTFQVVQGSRA